MTELNLAPHCLSVGFQRPTVRLSKQAIEFLTFLQKNELGGSEYFVSDEDRKHLGSISMMIADRQNIEHYFPSKMTMKGEYYVRAISIIHYIEVTGKSEVRDSGYGFGGLWVVNHSVRHSVERTVKTLWKKQLVSRFKYARKFRYHLNPFGTAFLHDHEASK